MSKTFADLFEEAIASARPLVVEFVKPIKGLSSVEDPT